jgi:ABC-type transport system involved in multi-copper enzyme maturation permease subunit
VWQRHSVFWKELHTTGFGRIRRHILVAVGLILGLLTLSALIMQNGGVGAAFLWLGGMVLHFLAMARGAGLFVQEREERKWEVLLSTPLTAREILWSKVLAGVIPLLPFALFYFGILTLFSLAWRVEPLGWFISTGALFIDVLFAYGVGAWASLRSRTLRASFSLTFGIVLSEVLIIPIFLLIVSLLTGFARNDVAETLIPILNPAPSIAPLTELLADRSPGDWTVRRVGESYDKIAPCFLAYAALHLSIVAGLFASMGYGFRRITGRS